MVETITNYPLPPFRGPNYTESWPTGTELEILRRLGAIEDRLSKIELELTKQQPAE